MGLVREFIDSLDEPRNCRNDCAHPSGIFVSADEALELVESIREAVSRQVNDDRLTNIAILREFIKEAEEPEGRAIARWVQDDLCAQLAHDLLTMYLRDEEVENVSGVVGLWQELWHRSDDDQKRNLWNRLAQAVETVPKV